MKNRDESSSRTSARPVDHPSADSSPSTKFSATAHTAATPYITIGPKGGKGRVAQVKAAVTPRERELFYSDLAHELDSSLSDIIRGQLINLAISHGLLPEDYDQGKGR